MDEKHFSGVCVLYGLSCNTRLPVTLPAHTSIVGSSGSTPEGRFARLGQCSTCDIGPLSESLPRSACPTYIDIRTLIAVRAQPELQLRKTLRAG